MISYAQNGEDVILNRLFPPEYKGFYVDAGAAHPDVHSVTRHFYERGWRGINIEPLQNFYDLVGSWSRSSWLTASSPAFGLIARVPERRSNPQCGRSAWPCRRRLNSKNWF